MVARSERWPDWSIASIQTIASFARINSFLIVLVLELELVLDPNEQMQPRGVPSFAIFSQCKSLLSSNGQRSKDEDEDEFEDDNKEIRDTRGASLPTIGFPNAH
jgi:hypothetical protein